MSKTTSGQAAYAVYTAAVGGTTFDDRPLPTFEQLGERQQAAWQTVADRGASTLHIGSPAHDKKRGVSGTISAISINRHHQVGAWLDCVDSVGRPFEHYAYIEDLE